METNKYSRGKIYRVVSNVSDKQYIGSTIRTLAKRMKEHRCVNKKNTCSSKQIFEEDGVENCDIVLIENYPCSSKKELLFRERYFIETMNCVNKASPIKTEEEDKQDKKKYYEEHKERSKQRSSNHYYSNIEKSKEIRKEYRNNHKNERKEYLNNNKQKTKEYNKEYGKLRWFRKAHAIGLFSLGI